MHRAVGCRESFGNQIEIAVANPERWVGLCRRREVLSHADVKLVGTARKPDAAAAPESLGLFQFGESK